MNIVLTGGTSGLGYRTAQVLGKEIKNKIILKWSNLKFKSDFLLLQLLQTNWPIAQSYVAEFNLQLHILQKSTIGW